MYHLLYEDLARARTAQLTRSEHNHGVRRRSLTVALEVRRRLRHEQAR